MHRALLLLAQQSLASGSLSDLWKRALITPIHKKGCKFQPSNYRLISLTYQMVKLIDALGNKSHFLTKSEVLNPCQHGFVKHKSCLTNLLESHSTWIGALGRHSWGLVLMLYSYLDYSI